MPHLFLTGRTLDEGAGKARIILWKAETASRIIAVSKTVQIQPAVSVKLRKFKKRENMVPLILLVVLTVNNKLSFAAVALGKAEVHPGKAQYIV